MMGKHVTNVVAKQVFIATQHLQGSPMQEQEDKELGGVKIDRQFESKVEDV